MMMMMMTMMIKCFDDVKMPLLTLLDYFKIVLKLLMRPNSMNIKLCNIEFIYDTYSLGSFTKNDWIVQLWLPLSYLHVRGCGNKVVDSFDCRVEPLELLFFTHRIEFSVASHAPLVCNTWSQLRFL